MVRYISQTIWMIFAASSKCPKVVHIFLVFGISGQFQNEGGISIVILLILETLNSSFKVDFSKVILEILQYTSE